MRKAMDFDLWLDWFIVDNKLNIQEVLLEEIIDGQPYKVKMVDFLNKVRKLNHLTQQKVKDDMCRELYSGGKVSKALKEDCRELISSGKLLL
ncbi:hypothetical protein SAMN05216390_10176 [Lachnospiraceae bacterium KH1T2]|nr:hypothetical protein SAMN05216390_10176 [Lachnospiraceae bacterium KH1T2]